MSGEAAADPVREAEAPAGAERISSQDAAQPLREAARRRTLRAWAAGVDLALYKKIRALAVDPERTRYVKAYSTLGEHGLLWLGIGSAGFVLDRSRRAEWKRATLIV